MTNEPTRKPRIALQVDEVLMKRLRAAHKRTLQDRRMATFSDTMRELIEAGLQQTERVAEAKS